MRRGGLALLLLAACTKADSAGETTKQAAPPAPPPAPAVSAPPAPFIVAENAYVISADPLRWERDGHLWEPGADPRKPLDLGERLRERDAPLASDADHAYVSRCTSDCDIDHGQHHTLTRIDRRDGTRRDLVESDPFDRLRVVGDQLIWMYKPYSPYGELRRMHRDGGAIEVLWKRTDATMNDYAVHRDGILAWSYTAVAWIPDGKPVQELATGLNQPNAAALDATHVYVSEYGDPHGQRPDAGRIVRIPRGGGAPEVIAGSLRRPRGVAVDDRNVYWVVEEDLDLRVAPKAGGPARTIALPPSGAPLCRITAGLYAGPAGLYVQRAGHGRDCVGTITFVPTR